MSKLNPQCPETVISLASAALAAPPSKALPKPIYRGHIAELDALRAVGICMVILTHMWRWESFSPAITNWLQLTWMLMDGFFVISGFLITGILLDSRQRTAYYRSFFIRRSLRILPIYYAVLILITLVATLHGHAAYREMAAHWGSPWWFFVYLGNIPTAITGQWPLAAGGAFVSLWSLQIEEQFYLLFPFLVRRLNLKTLTRLFLAFCCFSTALRIFLYFRYPSNELVQYVSLPSHCEGLALGAWMAVRFRQGPWPINKKSLTLMVLFGGLVSLGFAAWAGYYVTQPLNRTIGILFASIWFTCIVLWLIQFRGSKWTAILRTWPFQYVGKISYCAYLIHWPVANAITVVADSLRIPAFDQSMLRLLLIYVLTFGLSALSWHWFENPIHRLKDRWFPAPA